MEQIKTSKSCGCHTIVRKIDDRQSYSMSSLCAMHRAEEKDAADRKSLREMIHRARNLDVLTCDGCGQYLCDAVCFDLNSSYFYHKGCAEELKSKYGNTQQ